MTWEHGVVRTDRNEICQGWINLETGHGWIYETPYHVFDPPPTRGADVWHFSDFGYLLFRPTTLFWCLYGDRLMDVDNRPTRRIFPPLTSN